MNTRGLQTLVFMNQPGSPDGAAVSAREETPLPGCSGDASGRTDLCWRGSHHKITSLRV
jgi:hypothetical protein